MTLRVGLIGAGFARRVQLPAMTHVAGVRAVAIASATRSNAEAAAREFDIPSVYDDALDLVRDPQVDAVFVASTPLTHARFAIAALDAGKHVLCEKPAAVSAGEVEEMLAAAQRRPDRLAWIDHQLRYDVVRRKACELIRAGAIGDVRHIELSLSPYFRSDGRGQTNQPMPWTWWSDAAQGGGVLGAVGSHLIDLCRFWTGSDVRTVAGGVATWSGPRRDAGGVTRPVTAEEFGSFVLFLTGGAVATLTLSAVSHYGPGHFAQINGSSGALVITGETTLQLGRGGAPLEDVATPDDLRGRTRPDSMWARGFTRLLRDFVRAAQGASPEGEPATFADGFVVQRVLDAVRAGGSARLD